MRFQWRLAAIKDRLAGTTACLESLSPLAVLARGYSVTSVAGGQIVRDSAQVEPGQTIVSRLAKGEITSRVESKR